MDNDRGIAVRMWKGYRDAQTAWLSASDDMNAKTRVSGRKALFLVIYAPRKGQVEVFSMQQGPKVASFPVSKSGRYQLIVPPHDDVTYSLKLIEVHVYHNNSHFLYSLISLPYGMMGLNNIPLKGVHQQTLPCLFLDPEGQLLQLHIPFHLSLKYVPATLKWTYVYVPFNLHSFGYLLFEYICI